ncbi:carbohydrate ABC transporter membrane protein 1, CUT1 family [Micromonospora phaseoli]|uniref:Carbohydrate ABC transporter membrane protein 1, CUT1 family n=1 Tax=Micromonospora phaseoli TaxID=1144548 RepID=A0A1H7DN15_9ACTN|nr:sugar ABC transporter permease [Micromonospora phaseoli]PZV89481.1 carbohydrate ABC transporter membrane protein 1 (CUT1 family) [Micromonospora phaseoli]GIJ80605.1 sugar ABC transporter permease [Micromonospora phaseoli]SEK03159.1 carbohydrate ABC transporter membrane protein 1, CUT1 family [Micromonospora phaseoli]
MRHGVARFVTGFLALPVGLYLFYVVWPFLQAAGYSLTDWGGYSDRQQFVGLDNYIRLFSDELIRKAFWHNVFFLITVPLFTIALALFLAFLLNVGGREDKAGIRGVFGSGLYKVIFFFPQVLSLVVIAVMWQQIYRADGQGLINGMLMKIGLVNQDDPITFMYDPEPFLGVPAVLWWLLLIAVWSGAGFYMVLFSAAMQSIPKDIYEAAILDGAGRFHTFFRITLPLLRDTVSVAWVYLGFIALDMYALVFVMTPSQGGPNHASEIFASVLNFTAFQKGQFGYACAMGVALAIFTILLAAAQLRITRRERIEY